MFYSVFMAVCRSVLRASSFLFIASTEKRVGAEREVNEETEEFEWKRNKTKQKWRNEKKRENRHKESKDEEEQKEAQGEREIWDDARDLI